MGSETRHRLTTIPRRGGHSRNPGTSLLEPTPGALPGGFSPQRLDPMTTRDTLTRAIADTLGLHHGGDGISDDQTLADLGADSLDAVEIAMAVETALDLPEHIPDLAIETGTVGQLVAAIDAMGVRA